MDLACLAVGASVGVVVRFIPEERIEYAVQNFDGWLLLFGSVLLANYLTGSYKIQHTYSRFNLFLSWAFSLAFALLMISIFSYTWFNMVLGRGVLGLSIVTYSALALMAKFLTYRRVFRSKMALCRTLVVGTGDLAQEVRQTLERPSVLPVHRVLAFVHVDKEQDINSSSERSVDGVPVISASTEELPAIARNLGVTLVVVASDDRSEVPRLYAPLKRLRFEGREVLMPLDVAEIYDGRTPLYMVDEKVMMHACLECMLPIYRRFKRFMDVALSLMACVVLTPLTLFIAGVLKLRDPESPVLRHEKRVGLFGHTFSVLKFRTRCLDNDLTEQTAERTERQARATWLDALLHISRLEKLPQLIHVLRGEMSLVGPKPEPPEAVQQASAEIPWYDERYNVLPGITGWAQIRSSSADDMQGARQRLEYDLFYLKHMSLSLDLQIMLRSLRIIVFGRHSTN